MPYDPEGCYMPAKRPSLEDLKRVSRVKNNSMFREGGQEYDPAQVSLPIRPLAADRSPNRESQMNLAKAQFADESDTEDFVARPPSPSKDQPSPGKSSLSKASRFGKGFNPSEIWSEYDSAGHRHAKSVTFDAAPPQVNEYEMRTPDPSSIASGSRENSYDSEDEDPSAFEYEYSMERDDSFDASLEDIEKTPVVMPEDWRFMSPASAEDEESFTEHAEEDHDDERPISRDGETKSHNRVDSLDSNGDRRPLPPLPSVNRLSGSRPSSAGKLASAFELSNGSQRGAPAPLAPASFSKSDISGAMSLEERLRLMMLNDKQAEDEENKEELNKASEAVEDNATAVAEKITDSTESAKDEDVFSPPRISRDSILKDIRKDDDYDEDDIFDDDSHIASSPNPYDHYDPDVPIPSLETDYDHDDDDSSSVIVKEEAHDDDLYTIPDFYQNMSDNSLSSRDQRAKYDEDSNYSLRSAAEADANEPEEKESGQTTPVPGGDNGEPQNENQAEANEEEQATESQPLDMASIRQSLGRPVTPEIKDEPVSEPSTPDSVIRHPIEDEEVSDEEEEEEGAGSSSDESVPEPVATIRAPGMGLKTRPSLTPADMESMAATRRKISGQHPPPMPQLTKTASNESKTSESEPEKTADAPKLELPNHLLQRQSSLMKLDIPLSIQEESLGSGLDKEFDRVIESQKVAFHLALSPSERISGLPSQDQQLENIQDPGSAVSFQTMNLANQRSLRQRGYLMRQNTKVVIASNRNEDESGSPPESDTQELRGTRSAGSSPRKASQQTWTTVPWNSQPRRPSVKLAGAIPKKKPVPGSGGVPPLPGQSSNVQEASAIAEESEQLPQDMFEEGEERGRLFVKVVGIKYMDLPLPKGMFPMILWVESAHAKLTR